MKKFLCILLALVCVLPLSGSNMIKESREYYSNSKGTLYHRDSYYYYVPAEVNEETQTLLYFAGGSGSSGQVLDTYLIKSYVKEYAPNAIAIFFINSGWNHYKDRIQLAYELLDQLTAECGIEIQNLHTAGSSLGGAVALPAAVILYEEYNIPVLSVSILDMAFNWDVDNNLNKEQRKLLAEEGTILYLYEQSTRVKYSPIQKMIDAGTPVVMIGCHHGGHDDITKHGFLNGIFSYAFGEYDTLSEEEYQVVPQF